MRIRLLTALTIIALAGLAACTSSSDDDATHANDHDGGTHTHADGTTHGAHDGTHEHADGTVHDDHASAGGHDHDEVSIGTAIVGDITVELAQGHGTVAAGKESHLVVKLPYTDAGASVVRAWIGTADRTLSRVGKGDYAASHDDYDVHATAPDPLPEDALWWIEIEKPDGTVLVGSATPLTE